MTQFYRVLYCSRNSIIGNPGEVAVSIDSILAVSRRNNSRDGLSGGLLFSEGCFVQVLEGPLAAVEAAFERIQCDERHSDVTVVQSGPIAARDFPKWSMAFTGASRQDHPQAGVVLAGAFSGRSTAGKAVLEMLRGLIKCENDWLTPLSHTLSSQNPLISTI